MAWYVLPLFVGGASLASITGQQYLTKTASSNAPGFLASSMISIPLTYLYSGVQEGRARRGEPISFYGDTVRKHPFIMGLTHGLLGSQALKLMTKTASISNKISEAFLELPEEKFNEIYDVIIGKKIT